MRMMCFQFQFSYVHCESVEIQLVLCVLLVSSGLAEFTFQLQETFYIFVDTWDFLYRLLKPHAKKFFFFFSNLHSFYFPFCHMVLSRISNTMKITFLFLILGDKFLSFAINNHVTTRIFVDAVYQFEISPPLFLSCCEIFDINYIGFCQLFCVS